MADTVVKISDTELEVTKEVCGRLLKTDLLKRKISLTSELENVNTLLAKFEETRE